MNFPASPVRSLAVLLIAVSFTPAARVFARLGRVKSRPTTIAIAAFCTLVWLAISGLASAVEPLPREQVAFEDPFTGFKFPKQIGAYKFAGQAQFPRVQLGYGVNYVDNTGAAVSIAIYDMNFTDIADGTSDLRVLEEFQQIDAGIAAMVKQGGYRSAARNESLPQLSKAWLQVNHELVDGRGARLQTYSFIRGQSRKFVKIRVTTASQGAYARLPPFLLGISRAIGMLNEKPANSP